MDASIVVREPAPSDRLGSRLLVASSPSILEVGEYGIPLHDELEFELRLEPRDD